MSKIHEVETVTINPLCVGMGYRMSDAELSQLAQIVDEEAGMSCTLQLEPSNEVDPKAVKVIGIDSEKKRYNGAHLGYIQRPVNEHLFDLIRRGATVKSCWMVNVDEEDRSAELDLTIRRPAK